LKATTPGKNRVKEKHAIRKQIHKQLDYLFEVQKEVYAFRYLRKIHRGEELSRSPSGWPLRFQAAGFHFVPLISKAFELTCGLEILFLRREAPGAIVSGGDIDNRIKTLFDALRIPTAGEINDSPEAGENPFFCLLEDDSLITEVSVSTDRLLKPLQSEEKENDVVLVLNVTVFGWEQLGVIVSG
jgi:hypothetical protein